LPLEHVQGCFKALQYGGDGEEQDNPRTGKHLKGTETTGANITAQLEHTIVPREREGIAHKAITVKREERRSNNGSYIKDIRIWIKSKLAPQAAGQLEHRETKRKERVQL
jgi:hypothetical protein